MGVVVVLELEVRAARLPLINFLILSQQSFIYKCRTLKICGVSLHEINKVRQRYQPTINGF